MSCLPYVTDSNVAECSNCPIKVSELLNKINLPRNLLDGMLVCQHFIQQVMFKIPFSYKVYPLQH